MRVLTHVSALWRLSESHTRTCTHTRIRHAAARCAAAAAAARSIGIGGTVLSGGVGGAWISSLLVTCYSSNNLRANDT